MTCETCFPFGSTQHELIKFMARGFVNESSQEASLLNHGSLPYDVDIYQAFGFLLHGHDPETLGFLSTQLFGAFDKCFAICLERHKKPLPDGCELCNYVQDLAKHCHSCKEHPKVCQMCQSLYNLVRFHLIRCIACDLHVCIRLKVKMMKRRLSLEDGLLALWPKLQQYLSRLFPSHHLGTLKSGELDRYPSTFDYASSSSDCSAKPSIVSRGPVSEGELEPDLDEVFSIPLDMHGAVGYNPSPRVHQKDAGSQHISLTTQSSVDDSVLSPSGLGLLQMRPRGLKQSDGRGAVIFGEPRSLKKLASYWTTLKQTGHPPTDTDGVILTGKNHSMMVINNQYNKNEHWCKVVYLGAGMSGKCFLAVDKNSSAQFAVKKLELAKYEEDELVLWCDLEHPSLVQLYGATRCKDKFYIFSEFYAAGNLSTYIKSQWMLDQWISLFFIQQLFEALVYLKSKSIIHEDIKADNVFLKPDSFKIGLGDFGLSKRGRVPANAHPVGGQTQWSPEKAQSIGHSFPADVWATVCTFVHMLSGSPPWVERYKYLHSLHFKIFNESPPVEDIPPGLLHDVEKLIKDGWVIDPDERPQASEILLHTAFELLNQSRFNPDFRSHITTRQLAMDEGDMIMSSCSDETQLSLNSILAGLDDEQGASQYVQELMDTGEETPVYEDESDTFTQPSSNSLRRSGRLSRMESIREENPSDDSVCKSTPLANEGDSVREKRNRPVMTPLIMPSQDKPARLQRSNTSPSPSHGDPEFEFKTSRLVHQESSPAILMSSNPEPGTDPCDLSGFINIFDLKGKGAESGYMTGSGRHFEEPECCQDFDSYQYLEPESSLSLYQTPLESMVDGIEPLVRMQPIASSGLQVPNSTGRPPEETFDLSSLSSMKRSTKSEPMCIYLHFGDDTTCKKVVIQGYETWQQIVETTAADMAKLGIDGYTFYSQDHEEIDPHAVVPKEGCAIKVLPSLHGWHWQIHSGKLVFS